MENYITSIRVEMPELPSGKMQKPKVIPREVPVPRQDAVEFGKGKPLSSQESMNLVYERAMAKLQSVVEDARAQLGIAPDAVFDTSNEATATRIADFALGAFSSWQKNNAGLEEGEARKQFAKFIGDAISTGIGEAKGILGALQALTPDVENNISSIEELINQRLNDFVTGSGQA